MTSPIDETPLQIAEVNARGLRLVVRPDLEFQVERAGQDMLSSRIEALGIMVFGSSRQSLQDSLEAAIAETWTRYLTRDPDEPMRDVSEMRCRLISLFRPY
jgi:hypothetical protein